MSGETKVNIPARAVPVPQFISPGAQAFLTRPATESEPWPEPNDKAGWRARVAAIDAAFKEQWAHLGASAPVKVEDRRIDGVRVFDIKPDAWADTNRGVILDMHGGGLILCGGELCAMMGAGIAELADARVWAVDYRMPPDHPYPAALDDGLAVYRALLRERAPQEIVFHGASAGGNLIAALALRARDEGLPLPAAIILQTPEIDLTESGDSFHTNLGVDPILGSLMPANILYANGQDLRHPYLSPLFGDFSKGFPPALLTTGTRDLYLSNTVRMHRALRAADIPAELHVTEAGGHGGFPGTPEGDAINREIRRFVHAALPSR